MRITLAELELHRVTASESYAPGALDYHGAEFRQTAPLKLDVTAELLGAEIRIRGHLATCLETGCDRCLGVVQIPVNSDFDLFYRPMKTIAVEGEIEIPTKELEIGFYSGDGIELADVATEQVILSVPMKVVCKPDCKGLCPVCRVNRNLARCDCAPPQQDSPFASLMEE
ncbi:MAG: YceD family protein [Terriglobia bacterium]